MPVHSIKRIAKDLCFTTIDNLTTSQRHSHKKRKRNRVVSIRSVHYLVAFAPAAGELIIFTAAGCCSPLTKLLDFGGTHVPAGWSPAVELLTATTANAAPLIT